MPKNNNLITVSKLIPTKSSHVVLGTAAVPAGMTRYVTMVKATQVQGASGKGSRVYFCSAAASGTGTNQTTASAIQKLNLAIPSAVISAAPTSAPTPIVIKSRQVPAMSDSENPLFTIAESKWFTATLSSATGASSPVNVFAQYYDQ